MALQRFADQVSTTETSVILLSGSVWTEVSLPFTWVIQSVHSLRVRLRSRTLRSCGIKKSWTPSRCSRGLGALLRLGAWVIICVYSASRQEVDGNCASRTARGYNCIICILYIYIYMYIICVYIYIYTYVYIYMYIYIYYLSIYLFIDLFIYLSI